MNDSSKKINKEFSTPHIHADSVDLIGDVVIMPGDPVRAKNFAQKNLTDIRTFNGVRGMTGYTGMYKGEKITVHPSGMGMPSAGIYSFELYKFANVKLIIRMGTCGGYNPKFNVGDVVIGKALYTESTYNEQFLGAMRNMVCTKKPVLDMAVEALDTANIHARLGVVHSADVFYAQRGKIWEVFEKSGIKCDVVEMEAFAIAVIAEYLHKDALSICAISDHLNQEGAVILTAEQRAAGIGNLFNATLAVAHEFAKKYRMNK